MGTFAGTASSEQLSIIVCQPRIKQKSVFCFCLQQTNGCRLRFPFAKNKRKFWVFRWFHSPFAGFRRHGDEDGDMEASSGKWKPRRFSLIHLPFVHCPNRSLSSVHLLTKKQMKVIRLSMDKRTCPSMSMACYA